VLKAILEHRAIQVLKETRVIKAIKGIKVFLA
jgi:hypothetical protein